MNKISLIFLIIIIIIVRVDIYSLPKEFSEGFFDLCLRPSITNEKPTPHNYLCVVKIKDKYGYINKKGIIVIKPIFEDANDFNNNIAKIKIENKIKCIDLKGKYVKCNK